MCKRLIVAYQVGKKLAELPQFTLSLSGQKHVAHDIVNLIYYTIPPAHQRLGPCWGAIVIGAIMNELAIRIAGNIHLLNR